MKIAEKIWLKTWNAMNYIYGLFMFDSRKRLSNLKNNSDWQTRTEVNTKKYKQVSIESIIRRLASLSM